MKTVPVKFPVKEQISYRGVVKEHTVNEGQELKCLCCHFPFKASSETAYMEEESGNVYFECPNCNYRGGSYYYCLQSEGKIVRFESQNDILRQRSYH